MEKDIDKYSVIEVVELLKEKCGYKQYNKTYESPYTYKTLLQKRVESDDVCELNDKLYIDINVSEFIVGGKVIEEFSVKINAEKSGKWWSLQCYSINRCELFDNLDEVEETLIKLFNNI